jgi:hypothetical protein
MKDTQLVGLLKNFSVYEMNRLEKFVISPFFNKNEKAAALLKVLREHHPLFESPQLEKRNVYKRIFKTGSYNDKKMRDVTYELLKLAEEFIGISVYQSRKQHFPELDILTGLGEKQQRSLFEKRAKAFEEKTGISSCANSVYFYNKWVSANTKLHYRYFFYGKALEGEQLTEEADALILFTLVNLSYVYYNISTLSHTGSEPVNTYLIDEFMRSINLERICSLAKMHNHKYAGIIEVYYCMIMMIAREEDESFFYRLKDIMARMPPALSGEDIFNIYTNLTAYCVRQIIKGKSGFHRQELEIYKDQLKKNAYGTRDDITLSPVIYHNIVLLCFYLKEYEWVESFIRDYSSKLTAEDREDMYNYSYASLYLEKKQFEKALPHISRIKIEHFYLKLEVRYLLLKTHYELGNYETVISLIDSSSHFLKKARFLSAERKRSFGNFLKFLNDVVKLKTGSQNKTTEQVKERLSAEIVMQKSWLMEKLHEI